MLRDLEAAARAYAAALAAVTDAQERLAEARQGVPAARQHLAEEIVRATLAGARQVDVMAASGYSREQVRRILRSGGVEPD